MSRRESREKAFMFLYQLEIQKGDATRQLADFLTEREVGENDQEYLLALVEGVSNQKPALDEKSPRCSNAGPSTACPGSI